MVDKVEATKNLKKLEDDHYHLAHLNHLNSSQEFKNHCAKRMKNIQENINAIKYLLKQG
jgi:hypothetical protein